MEKLDYRFLSIKELACSSDSPYSFNLRFTLTQLSQQLMFIGIVHKLRYAFFFCLKKDKNKFALKRAQRYK